MKIHLIFSLLLISSLTLWAKETTNDPEEKQKAEIPKPKTHKVVPSLFRITFDADGSFAAPDLHEVSIDTQSWSMLTVIEALSHGAEVSKGEVLVKLEREKIEQKIRDLRLELEVTALDLKVAEAELELQKNTSPLEMAAIERRNKQVQEDLNFYRKTQLPHKKESAEAALKSAKDSLSYVEEELKQLKKMYEADDLTEETEEIILKRAQASVERARFTLKGAEIRKTESLQFEIPRETLETEEGARRSELSLQTRRKTHPVGLIKKRIEVQKLKLQYEQAKENHKRLQDDLGKMRVTASIAGTLFRGTIDQGKWSGSSSVDPKLRKGGVLKPNEVFMTIVPSNSRLKLHTSVPEKYFKHLSKGLKAEVRPTISPDTILEASVSEVSKTPDSPGQHALKLTIKVPNESQLSTGMTAKITFVAYEQEKAIWIPKSAFEQGDEPKIGFVNVYRKDRNPRRQKVSIGNRHENKIEVLKGLRPGAEVLLEKPSK